MMSATAFSTWSLFGCCVRLRDTEQQLKICSSVLLLRHRGHGGDSVLLLKNRLDRLLQRQWINLRKLWAGCIEMYFSHRFPICFFSFLVHFLPDYTAHYSFPLIYVLFVQHPCIPWVTIEYKYLFSPPSIISSLLTALFGWCLYGQHCKRVLSVLQLIQCIWGYTEETERLCIQLKV